MFVFHLNQGGLVSVWCFLRMPLFCLTLSYPLTLTRWSIHSLPRPFTGRHFLQQHGGTPVSACINEVLPLHLSPLCYLLLLFPLCWLFIYPSSCQSVSSWPFLNNRHTTKIRQATWWIETSVAIYKGSTSRELFPFLIRCFANWCEFLITAKRNLMLTWGVGQVWNHPECEGRHT